MNVATSSSKLTSEYLECGMLFRGRLRNASSCWARLVSFNPSSGSACFRRNCFVELPNTLNAARVAAPHGRVIVASAPLGRVQRYGSDGFERAFYVD
jgi:hypothetical protein